MIRESKDGLPKVIEESLQPKEEFRASIGPFGSTFRIPEYAVRTIRVMKRIALTGFSICFLSMLGAYTIGTKDLSNCIETARYSKNTQEAEARIAQYHKKSRLDNYAESLAKIGLVSGLVGVGVIGASILYVGSFPEQEAGEE